MKMRKSTQKMKSVNSIVKVKPCSKTVLLFAGDDTDRLLL